MDKVLLTLLVAGMLFLASWAVISLKSREEESENSESNIILNYKNGYDCALEWIRTGSDPHQLAEKAKKEEQHTSTWKKGWNQACLDEIEKINSKENV